MDLNEQTLRDNLELIGLSSYQADAYVTLLELGTASAVDVANASDVPQGRVYDVIRDLESKEYVETYQKGSLHARAQDPRKVISELEAQAESTIETAEAISEKWEQPSMENHQVSVVNQMETVFNWAEEYISEAEEQVLIAASVSQYSKLVGAVRDAFERAVLVNVSLHPDSNDEHSLLTDEADIFEDAATEVRLREQPGPFMLICDYETVCFGPEMVFHPSNEYGLLTRDYTLGRVFRWYYRTAMWESAESIYRAAESASRREFRSIRQCIREIQSRQSDERMTATVRGRFVSSGEEATVTGHVVNTILDAGPVEDDEGVPAQLNLPGQRAIIELDTGDEHYTIGGWGATHEDIEAEEITIQSAVQE